MNKVRSVKINAILNILKTVCSIIFPLITIPYASRVLHASNYGKVNWGNSIIQYFALFATLGVVTYAQREGPRIRDRKTEFEEFASEVFTVNVIATIISYIGLFAMLLFWSKAKDYRQVILIQSLIIILTTIGADWINTIYEDYFYITLRYIIIQIVALICLFIFVKTPGDYLIYALIMSLAAAGGNLFNIFYIRRYTHIHLVNPRSCRKHMAPTLKLFAVSLASVFYVSSDITILGIFHSNKDVGIYSISSKVYSTLRTVLNAAMVVAMPRLSFYLGHHEDQDYVDLLKNIVEYLMTFIFPVICGLFMLAKPVMLILGGVEFTQGTLSLQILSVSLFFAVFACFFASGVILLYKRDNVYLVATLLSSAVNVLLNFVLIPYFSYNGAAFTTLLAEMIMMLMTGYYSFKEENVHSHAGDIFINHKILISTLIGSVAIIIICMMMNLLLTNQIILIIASFIGSVVAYSIILAHFKNPIFLYVLEAGKRKLKHNSHS